MLQTAKGTRIEESVYRLIGDAGPVAAASLSRLLQIDEVRATVWLRSRAISGHLYRDEFGGYSTTCPWPRVGL